MAEFIAILKEIRGTTFDVNGVPTNGMWFDVKTSHAAVMLLEGSTVSAAAAAVISKDAAAAAAAASGSWAAAAVISKDAAAAAAAAAVISKDAAAASAAAALISKDAAATAAVTATAKSNEIKGITVASVSTGIAGSAATVSYNPLDGKFYFTIPQGTKGDKGDNFAVNSMGLFAQRALYDAQIGGFSFLAFDTSMIYFKLSSTSGDWSLGSPFGKGDKGDQGEIGYGWLHGAGLPDNATGRDNDFYMNMATANVYIKVAGTWNYFVNLAAPIDDTTVSALTTWSSEKVTTELTLKANQSETYTVLEINDLLSEKQANLVSGTNIATVNGEDLTLGGNITIGSIGFGGAVANVPLTLTSASESQQSLTASAWNQSVTLPDATTLSLGVTVFGLYNNSRYHIQIKDAGGTLLGFISPFKHVICSLVDNTTSAGVWNLSGHEHLGFIGLGNVSFSYVGLSGLDIVQTMTSTLIDVDKYLVLCSMQGGYLEGVVYDAVAGVFGNSAIIRENGIITYVKAEQVSNGTALVVSAAGTSLQGVIVSVTGTTISVAAAVTETLSSIATATVNGDDITITKVGGTYIVGVAYSPSAAIIAMTVSGTTITKGTIALQTGAAVAPIIYDMGSSIVMALSQDASGAIYFKPYTVSGVTLTAGTSSFVSPNITGFSCRQLDSGRIALIYLKATGLFGSIISLSGTVASSTEVQLGVDALGTTNLFNVLKVGNQLICACGSYSVNANCINVLTDNAGTAVAGVDYGAAMVSGTYGMPYVGSTDSALYVISHIVNDSIVKVLKIVCSGNNPSVSTIGGVPNCPVSLPIYGQSLFKGDNFRGNISGVSFKGHFPAGVGDYFGIKDDAMVIAQRPEFIINSSTTHATSLTTGALIMCRWAGISNTAEFQIVKVI